MKNAKGEIDDNFYCSADLFVDGHCDIDTPNATYPHCSNGCQNRHRKHPTPEQFREEYGEEYPDDGAVWLFYGELEPECRFSVTEYRDAKLFNEQRKLNSDPKKREKRLIICACTPFGKPDDDWRPE